MPVIVGADHDTSNLVVGVPLLRDTVGAAGAAGGSFASVTLMVTAMVSSMAVLAVPSAAFLSVTFTVTLWEVAAS